MFRRVLSDIAVWIYQGITKMMEDEIHPILVQALLEHEGIGGLSGINLYVCPSFCLYLSYLTPPVYLSLHVLSLSTCLSLYLLLFKRNTSLFSLSLCICLLLCLSFFVLCLSLCLPLNVIRTSQGKTFLSLYPNCLSLSGIVSPSFSINGISLSPSFYLHFSFARFSFSFLFRR